MDQAQPPSGSKLVIALASVMVCGIGTLVFFLMMPGPDQTPSKGLPGETKAAEFSVNAESGWLRTGYPITAGTTYEITASGGVTLSEQGGLDTVVGPNGFSNDCAPLEGSPCLVSGGRYGQLVALIGEGDPFPLADAVEFTAKQSGELWLAVNDNEAFYEDNQGAFEVVVRELE